MRDLIETIEDADAASLANLVAAEDFGKRRAWLRANRKELSDRLESAIADAQQRVPPTDDDFPGDRP